MTKKNKLCIDLFDDVKVIGINTAMPDYQLAWNLNKTLGFNFVKYKNININDDIDDDMASPNDLCSLYLYDMGENANIYNLVALKSYEGKYWVALKPKLDYIFVVKNNIKDKDLNMILNKIKSISKVLHAYIIDLDINNKLDVVLERIDFQDSNR